MPTTREIRAAQIAARAGERITSAAQRWEERQRLTRRLDGKTPAKRSEITITNGRTKRHSVRVIPPEPPMPRSIAGPHGVRQRVRLA
jgi:hypothetical protein